MMSARMADRPQSDGKRRHAFRNMFLATCGVGVVITAAVTLLNQAAPGEPPVFSPVAAIAIVIAGLIGLFGLTYVYLKRTDEHDVMANLWGITVGWLFFICAVPAWWMLEHAGLVGPVDFWPIWFGSALVAAAAWAWYRFR